MASSKPLKPRSASIVKPTVPKNVLAEFQLFAATGNRYNRNQQNPFDDDEGAAHPPPVPVQQQPQPIAQQEPMRRQAPPPPAAAVVQQPPPQVQQRPVDFKDCGDFSMMSSTSSVQAPRESFLCVYAVSVAN